MAASSQPSTSAGSTPADDGLDSLLDFSSYDRVAYQQSMIQSPATDQTPSPTIMDKTQFAPSTETFSATFATVPPNPRLSGPSHQYDRYKQQTPLVPGALANTLAINELHGFNPGYINPGEEMYNFNASSSQNSSTTPEMDFDFGSPSDPTLFFPPTPTHSSPVDNANYDIDHAGSPGVTTQPATVGRMYPGIHQRNANAAMARARIQAQVQAHARAQVQQTQQQQEMLQRQTQLRPQQAKQVRPRASPPLDPIAEQKITQVLNSMRSKRGASELTEESPLHQLPRTKKEEEDMDADERLLNSEEGKKLSSKERRQLRNKVSARAFRSRRKEYIVQLETEINTKTSETNGLRAENQALIEENQRLTGLTRMLLSSPAFSAFLDKLSTNPDALPQAAPQMESTQPEPVQVPRDISPYTMMPFGQQQQIGMAMVPEQNMDLSTITMNSNDFNYQPQVFTVLETPELPTIDIDTLMGKSSKVADEFPVLDSEKASVPSPMTSIPSTIEKPQAPDMKSEPARVEKTTSNLDSDIFDDECSVPSPLPVELNPYGLGVDRFGGIESEKTLPLYELVDSSEEEQVASVALKRVERLAASLASTLSGLERLDNDV
ncbi:hypothetical protein NUW58_g688 [Xylaria curta]|uniref:Uncharacterized protein n=1 Tax=Xylaria curta TaxID=42375 RepID=A0ACC1PRM1_9PEZI|nr:hypothetical protein NUW58_g688 [Xylaria curta]